MKHVNRTRVYLSSLVALGSLVVACGALPSAQSSETTLRTQALPSCGVAAGYATYITYSASSLVVCRKATNGPYDTDPNTAGNQAPTNNPTHAYVVLARMGTSTSTSQVATVGHTYSRLDTGTNPYFDKKTAGDWFDTVSVNVPDIKVTINGQFFDCTENPGCANAAHSSFPIYTGTNTLVTTGNNAPIDDNKAKRALCFNSAGGTAAYKTWTLNSTNSTLANINAAQVGCANMIVGFAPGARPLDDAPSPYNFVGIRSSSGTNDTLCFYVGGYQTRRQAQQDLTNFGCTTAVEMDGGNSSQMSLLVGGVRQDTVKSWALPFGITRTVPHVFDIRF